MEIVCRKINLKDQKNDFEYWNGQPYQARLEAWETIRQEYHKWKNIDAESGLQRVYRISQR